MAVQEWLLRFLPCDKCGHGLERGRGCGLLSRLLSRLALEVAAEEFQPLRDHLRGACWRCHEIGHIAARCPISGTSPASPRGRAPSRSPRRRWPAAEQASRARWDKGMRRWVWTSVDRAGVVQRGYVYVRPAAGEGELYEVRVGAARAEPLGPAVAWEEAVEAAASAARGRAQAAGRPLETRPYEWHLP